MKGGKREGAGRPPAANPSTKQIKVMATPEQHKKWLSLGASRWLKRLIDESDGRKSPTSPKEKAPRLSIE